MLLRNCVLFVVVDIIGNMMYRK